MAIDVSRPKKEDVLKCVARFDELSAVDGGLPDQKVEGYYRTFRNVIGFEQPDGGEESFSPIGDEAKPKVSHLKPGFGMGYVSAVPGQGVMMHVHDTNETFMPISGKWRCHWNEGDDYEYIDAGPCDVVSFPPGVIRRFSCVEAPEGEEEALMMFVIGGEFPEAEYTEDANRIIAEHDAAQA